MRLFLPWFLFLVLLLIWIWISQQFPFRVEFTIFGWRKIGISLFPLTLRHRAGWRHCQTKLVHISEKRDFLVCAYTCICVFVFLYLCNCVCIFASSDFMARPGGGTVKQSWSIFLKKRDFFVCVYTCICVFVFLYLCNCVCIFASSDFKARPGGGTVKQSWSGFLQTFRPFSLHLLFWSFATTEVF